MMDWEQDRREFLKLLASLPVVHMIGCDAQRIMPGKAPLPGPDASLRKLIRLLGPWKEKVTADDFIRRFLGAEHTIAPYLPDGGQSIQSLAGRFPDDKMSLDTINLGEISEQERELLLQLTEQLYSFIEIRFVLSGEPPWGACQPHDHLRYTRAPE